MPPSIRSVLARHGDAPALRDQHQTLTWSAVDELIDRAAGRIAATDLGGERRLAVFAHNATETAIAYIAGLFGGASVVPVNYHLATAEAAYILRDSGSRVVLCDAATVDRALAAADAAGVGTVVAWGDVRVDGVERWEDWLTAAPAAPDPADVRPLPNLMYTSGTTGVPKGTEMPPTMFAPGDTVAEHVENMLATHPFAACGPHLVVGPMYHTGPLTSVRLLAGGVPLVIMERFDAEGVLAAIDEHRPGSSEMVPTHFVRLLDLPEDVRNRYDVSSIEMVGQTGAACPVPVKAKMIDWWGPVFLEAYGGSEVGVLCSITSEEWLDHPGSVGRPRDQFDVIVVDEAGDPLPPGVEGRLYFRDRTGRGIIYRNDPVKTAEAHLEPGVLTLGEVGYVDADGYVYITDRFGDMVVSGGVNLYPAEAEHVLIDHPAVADVACIGAPDPEMGERLVALVEAADPDRRPDSGELLDWCRDRLSHFKCPRELWFVPDLERDAMGKLNKRRLRDRWVRESQP